MKTIPVPEFEKDGILAFIRRHLLRLTAPKICRQLWKTANWKRVRICDMTDAHLLNTIFRLHRDYEPGLADKFLPGLEREACRRGLHTAHPPAWLLKRNEEYRSPRFEGRLRAQAEKLRRRESDKDKADAAFERLFGPFEGEGF